MAAKRITAGVLVAVLSLLLAAPHALADPRSDYLQAESCYRKLRQDPVHQKYRDQWMKCINGFEAVHSADPDGEWAAAGLYMAGTLYLELARRSFLASDRQEGVDRFQRIVKRHPDSAYRPRAEAAMAATASDKPSVKQQTRRLDPRSAEIRRIDAALTDLTKDTARRRYRHNWQKLIDASLAVYRKDPGGQAAPAALYTTGRLFQEMAAISRLAADRQEAADYYARVIRHFPTSAYTVEAKKQAALLSGGADASPPAGETVSPAEDSDATARARERYMQAESARRDLMDHASYQRYRDKWQRVIDAYLSATAAEPEGPWAAAGLYQAGTLYLDLYKKSYRQADQTAGTEILERVARDFPNSRYQDRARKVLAGAAPDNGDGAPWDDGSSDPVSAVIQAASAGVAGPAAEATRPGGTATVTGLRYWSNPRYTRVVIDADQEASFTHRLLAEDPSQDKPHRLFVDLEGSRLAPDVARIMPINDDLLSDARAGQNTSDTVRVVIDIKSFHNYKIFSLKNPFRVVIDVWGEETAPPPTTVAASPPTNGKKLPVGALARQLSLGVKRIVIDPGHGGKDYGAPGYIKGVHEKNIVLSLAKRLAEMLRTQLDCEVVLTRTGDTFLPLEERTAFANTRNADLFVSIHTNAARDSRAYGIETYFLNLATDDDAIRVAAFENATSTKNISDLQAILSDLMQNAKINESSRLATHVHENITQGLKKHYNKIKSKGIKQAPFYVLLGAQMPSVLVETAFISNPRECKRLTDPGYQKQLCQLIVDGIKAYIVEANPSAFHNGGGVDRNGKG